MGYSHGVNHFKLIHHNNPMNNPRKGNCIRLGVHMKDSLVTLIDQVQKIESYFHIEKGFGMNNVRIISDSDEFLQWKGEIQFELQDIYDRTHDQYIWDTLNLVKLGFSGWNDDDSFKKLRVNLNTIRKNVDKYYPIDQYKPQQKKAISSSTIKSQQKKKVSSLTNKPPKVFISHSSNDIAFVSSLVTLLEGIGLSAEQLLCSSVPGYGIPLDSDIYEFLKEQFQNFDLRVIFVLSEHYYQSVASMNEMGAAWVLQSKYSIILLPGFEFSMIKGAVNPRQIGIKFSDNLNDVKEKLGQLRNILQQEFSLPSIPDIRWEAKRDNLINAIFSLKPSKQSLSDNALLLLQTASKDRHGIIIKTKDLAGTHIVANGIDFIESQENREIAEWEACFGELLEQSLISATSPSGEVYNVTKSGYVYLDHIEK